MIDNPILADRDPLRYPTPNGNLSTGHLFSHFVCRVSGVPAGAVTSLQAPASVALLPALFSLETQLETRKDKLAATLYRVIGTVEHRKQRGRLIRLRRDIHNQRPVSDAQRAALEPAMPPELVQEIVAFQALQQEYAALLAALAEAYREEVPKLRKAFQQRLGHPDFQRGLLLSSRSLFQAQRRYQGQVAADLSSKHEKIERGLLRYFTRAAMKATPFGRFCAIIPGILTDEPNLTTAPLIRFAGNPEEKQSAVRLNKSLYSTLLRYLKARPIVRRHLHVELNPTIRNEQDRLLFLAAINGEEIFQRLTHNPVLDLIRALFRNATSRPLDDLVYALRKHPEIEASDEEAIQYLEKLIRVGLLRFRTGIREQEADWDVPFRTLLDPIDDERARQMVSLLGALREKIEVYSTVSVEEQAVLLDDMAVLIDEAGDGVPLRKRMMTGMLLYVDATAEAQARIPRAALEPIRQVLCDFIRLTVALAWPRTEQANLRHFFESHYEGRRALPLLQFYEDYYREHFKAHLEKQHAMMRQAAADTQETPDKDRYDWFNPFGLPVVKTIRDSHEALSTLIIERWKQTPDAEEINLTIQDLEDTLGAASQPALTRRSVSLFSQLVTTGDPAQPARLILRNGIYHDGYGKYFSRFLYLFPDTVQQEVFAANQELTDHYLAEICGDANFNANLHPPLMRWEISYPTGESGNVEQQLPAAALMVEADPEDPHALCLRHAPTGKRVVPVDLGFLNSQMRPPLYQLLMWFTPPSSFSIRFPEVPYTQKELQTAPKPAGEAETDSAPPVTEMQEEAASKDEPEEHADAPSPDQIWYRPRITFEGVLILARRCWRLYTHGFPARQAREASWEYFVRVNRWRLQHGIPDEVFVRIHPLASRPAPQKTDDPTPPGTDTTPEAAEQAQAEPPAPAEQGDPAEAPQDTSPTGETPTGETEDNDGAPPQPVAKAPKPYTKGSRDLYKPQYIDFRNPLLVGLFGKMTTNLKNFSVLLEERHPAAESLPYHHDQAFATELILQLNFPESPESEAHAPDRHPQEEVSHAAS